MLTNYTERKNEVLAEYEQFENQTKKLERTLVDAGLPSPLAQLKASLDDARRKAENIRLDRFRLMVVGEAKSGKSTFINAYLGVELMPMDVKQCTSSIVEIKYDSEFRLVATFADGKQQQCKGETNIRAFLKSNAAIDDNYRDIPVPTINHDLLVRYGRKTQGGSVSIPKAEIEAFLSAPEVRAANIHNISNYSQKICSYIEARKNDWRRIVVKLELFFPFEDEAFKGIEIIDSPGVCARGGVSEITSSYIENADAIIFLKRLTDDLTSVQFDEFMKNASVERNKNALFLVLTRATNLTPSDVKRKEEEALDIFNKLPRGNILIVDSKAELYADSFAAVIDVMERIRELNAKGVLDEFVKGVWLDSNFDKNAFIRGLKQKSNFVKINEALSVFGRKAHYIALASLLEGISKVYARIIGDLASHIARFKEKAEDPTELAKKIAQIKKELEEINDKIGVGIDKIASRYTGEEGEIKKNADIEAENFITGVNKIDKFASFAFDELRRQAMHMVNKFKEKQEELERKVIAEFNDELIRISNESDIPYTSLEPDFSEAEFDKIKADTKDSPSAQNAYTTGFFSPETEYSYSAAKHYVVVKKKTIPRVEEIKKDVIRNLTGFVRNIRTLYLQKLSSNADAKKAELDAIYQAKLNAEQIQAVIGNLAELSTACEVLKCGAEKVKRGIDKYVQQKT